MSKARSHRRRAYMRLPIHEPSTPAGIVASGAQRHEFLLRSVPVWHSRSNDPCWRQLFASAYVRNLAHTACSSDRPRRGAQGRFDPFAKPAANDWSLRITGQPKRTPARSPLDLGEQIANTWAWTIAIACRATRLWWSGSLAVSARGAGRIVWHGWRRSMGQRSRYGI